jgi:hypothetical protein
MTIGVAHADPTSNLTQPQGSYLRLDPIPIPAAPVPSLRLEAARVAGEVFDNSWRLPDTSPLLAIDGGGWWIGHGRYRPGSGRAAALHGGSMAATFLGELLLATDSPLAGVGALVTGATLDAAAADADRDAEAQRPAR